MKMINFKGVPLRTCLLFTLCVVMSGCDLDLMGEKKEQARLEAERRAEEARQQKETESQRSAMTQYANGKRKLFADRLMALEKESSTYKADASRLAEIVSAALEEKDSKGRDKKYESKLLGMLRNDEVNKLAVKYLASDFKSITAEYIARVRDTMKAESAYQKAVAEVDANYQSDMKQTQKWAEMTKEQRNEEIKRLRKEISDLESRRVVVRKEYDGLTRGKMIGSRRQELERYDTKRVVLMKVDELDRQIDRKRHQLDFLTSPDAQRGMSSRAMAGSQSSQSRANSIRQSAMTDIDRRLKPKKSVTDVVAEYDDQTVGKLRQTISDKVSTQKSEADALADKISAVDEMLLAIPVSNMSDLTNIKRKLEKLTL